MKFPCPHCHNNLTIESGNTGILTDCPHCGKPLSIPPSQRAESTSAAGPEFGGLDPAELLMRGVNTVQRSRPGMWMPPDPEELAVLLPQYHIEALIGRGGMGAVYKGRQKELDRPVAIKLLPAEIADEHFVARFRREARTLAKLQHPGIVTVYDFGQTTEGHLYFIMEFVDGTDLHQLIHGPGLSPTQTLELISQICEALQYAHERGVIHRDIKPANILITLEGRAKLADFGLARPAESEQEPQLTMANAVMGTPDYMAPEQNGGQTDHRADIYSLGVMLYEMLCKRTPRGAWHPPSHHAKSDERIDKVVMKAMQEEPAHRYQQASEVKTEVDFIRTNPAQAVLSPTVAVGKKAPRPAAVPKPQAYGQKQGNGAGDELAPMLPPASSSRKLWLGAAAAVLVLLAGGAWWLGQRKGEGNNSMGSGSAGATVNSTALSPEAASRKAAEWVLSLGGKIGIKNPSKSITSIADLPANPFLLDYISLDGLSSENKLKVTDESIRQLSTVKELVGLNLSDTAITDKGLAVLGGLPNLMHVNFAFGKGITGTGFAYLEACPKLEKITAWDLSLSPAGWEALGRISQLKNLYFSNNTFYKESFTHLKKLNQLLEMEVGMPASTDEDFEEVGSFTQLKGLGLYGSYGDRTIERVAKLKNLEGLVLRLSKSKISSSGFTPLISLPKLKSLTLSNVMLTTESFQQLAKIKTLEKLTVSDKETLVKSEAITAFLQVRPDVKVGRWKSYGISEEAPAEAKPSQPASADASRQAAEWVLSLGGQVGINGDSKSISSKADLPAEPFVLTRLNFESSAPENWAKVTDETIRILTGATKPEELWLHDNSITDKGTSLLGSLTTLKLVSLVGCKDITDETIKHFASSTQLRHFSVKGCAKITGDGFVHLQN